MIPKIGNYFVADYRGGRMRSDSGDFNRSLVEQAFAAHGRHVSRRLLARSGSADIAEDLAQEVFIRLGRLPNPDRIEDLQSYLVRMADNIFIDYLRSRRSRPSSDVEIADLIGPAAISDAPSPEQVAMARDELRVAQKALSLLPGACRQIFWMSRAGGRSNLEIADQLGVCVSTVEKNISRATRHCKSHMAAQL